MRRPRASVGAMPAPSAAAATLGGPTRQLTHAVHSKRRHLLASLAAGSMLLTRCAVAFHHGHVPYPARAAARRTRRGTRNSHPTHATRLPDQVVTTGTVTEDENVDASAVLDDLARGDVRGWEGHEYGFDWYLEQARRGMSSGSTGFTPLRMNFWRPTEAVEELSAWDTVYIILRNLGQMMGLPSVDNAPVAKIEKYTGSWLTFLQKVSNGRLEDLAGGPLFLMLEKYFLAEGKPDRYTLQPQEGSRMYIRLRERQRPAGQYRLWFAWVRILLLSHVRVYAFCGCFERRQPNLHRTIFSCTLYPVQYIHPTRQHIFMFTAVLLYLVQQYF